MLDYTQSDKVDTIYTRTALEPVMIRIDGVPHEIGLQIKRHLEADLPKYDIDPMVSLCRENGNPPTVIVIAPGETEIKNVRDYFNKCLPESLAKALNSRIDFGGYVGTVMHVALNGRKS